MPIKIRWRALGKEVRGFRLRTRSDIHERRGGMKGEWVEKVLGSIVQKSKQNKQSTCDVIKVMLFSGFASKELNDQRQNSGISIEF